MNTEELIIKVIESLAQRISELDTSQSMYYHLRILQDEAEMLLSNYRFVMEHGHVQS